MLCCFGSECWTDWFDRDDPSRTGDWETLLNLRWENKQAICPKPMGIEVQTVSGAPASSTGDVFFA